MLPSGNLSEADFNIKTKEVTSVIKCNQNIQNAIRYLILHLKAHPNIRYNLR